MESQIKDLYKEIEDDMYCCYIAHWVLYTTFEKAKVKKPKGENIPNEIAFHIYFAAKTQSDLNKYGQIIDDKITQEIGDNNDGSNEVVVAYHDPKPYYCVISPDVDYNSQDIIQPDFSIRDHIQNSDLHSLARKNYLHYYSNIVKKLMKFGVYDNQEEFQDKYFEDMVKAADQEQNVEECCCAGSIGGGVTTASFAPAVTHTVYPKPGKKKKKSKKEDGEEEIYWPVRNDETDAFEKMIIDARQAKKDKIIQLKTRTIERRNKNLNDWLNRVGDKMDLLKMAKMFKDYNKVTQKMSADLERIKKLPLDSPEFF